MFTEIIRNEAGENLKIAKLLTKVIDNEYVVAVEGLLVEGESIRPLTKDELESLDLEDLAWSHRERY
jgi:hypothetical protein